MPQNTNTQLPKLMNMGQWAWLIFCALLPIEGALVTMPLVLMIVVWCTIGLLKRPAIPYQILWPMVVYYALHIIGMFWSTDLAFGFFDLQIKSNLILLPLVVLLIQALRPELIHRGMVFFTGGFLLAMALGFAKAWGCYSESGLANCFSQSTLSYDLHPSYTAWYGCWIIAYWGHRLINGAEPSRAVRSALAISLPMIFVFVFMLASKTGVISVFVVIAFLLLRMVLALRGTVRWSVISGTVAIAIVVALTQGSLVAERMKTAVQAMTTFNLNPAELVDTSEGSGLRVVTWSCSLDRIGSAPFGAGTGDIKHALMDCYTANGATEAAKRKLNCHSQFLQGGVALGWPGIIATILLALVPLTFAIRKRSPLLGLFVVLFCVNASVESVLEVQAGVLFFALFGTILMSNRPL